MVRVALSTIAKLWKQPKWPLTDEWAYSIPSADEWNMPIHIPLCIYI